MGGHPTLCLSTISDGRSPNCLLRLPSNTLKASRTSAQPKSPHVQPDRVADGMGQSLFGPEIPFGSLDGGVAKQQLDLFQFPTGFAAELGARAAQIML